MCLWAPVLFATDSGHQLRDLGSAFVGRHVVPRYRGYMQSQGSRLVGTRGGGHGRRGGGQRDELVAAHGFDTKYPMHCARLGFQGVELLTTGRLRLPIEGEPADWLRAVRRGEVSFAEWWERCIELDAELSHSKPMTRSPRTEGGRIESWSVAAHRQA